MKSVKCGLKSSIASAAMGIVVYFLYKVLGAKLGAGTIEDIIVLGISAGSGALIYFVLIYLFKVEEMDWLIKIVRNRLNTRVET